MYLTTSKKIELTLSKHLCGPIYLIPAKGLNALIIQYILRIVPTRTIRMVFSIIEKIGFPISVKFKALHNISHNFNTIKDAVVIGYGRHDSGSQAVKIANIINAGWLLLEDGFIRSVGLCSDEDMTASLVVDDVGIYYDSRTPSKIENLLNYNESLKNINDVELANKAIDLIKKYNITKYNHAEDIPIGFFPKTGRKRILVIDQTKNDLSILYGNPKGYTFNDMLLAAIKENPDADIYFKPHPESISGYKGANISIDSLSGDNVRPIIGQLNIISILKEMNTVYVMSSQVGLEALLIGKEVVCFGAPFYAGWGLTDDRAPLKRRLKKRSLIELFIATYIKYIVYIDIETGKRCDVVQAIMQIINKKKNLAE